MNVNLYTCGDSPVKINKTLSNETVVEAVRFIEKDNFDLVNPSLLLNLGDDIKDITKYNYVRIPQFGRYYFINRWAAEGGLIRLDCHCDVLYSFRSSINNSTQYIARSQDKINRYMVDNLLPITSQNTYDVIKFGEPVDDRNCINVILETVGKGGVSE